MGCMSSGGSKSTSTTETKTPEQRKGIKQALDLYLQELGQGADTFPGPRVTPFSTLQQGAIAGAGNFADYFSDPQTAGTPLFSETGTAIKDTLAGRTGATKMGAPEIESYFTDTLYEPAMRNLREDVLPGVDESFSGPGFWGSARSHARQDAATDTRDLLAGQWADLNWNVQQQNQAIDEAKAGRTLTALPSAMAYGQVPAQEIKNNLQIAAQQLGGLGEIFGFGQTEQTQAQAELQDEIIRFAEENQITDPENLSIILSLLGMNFSQSSSSGSSQGPGMLYSMGTAFAGGFGGGIGKGMATPSP